MIYLSNWDAQTLASAGLGALGWCITHGAGTAALMAILGSWANKGHR
jgi:hypothetical protein